MINIIAAINRNGVIGKNGKIPWDCPADLKFFAEKTWGGILIMGRITYESIGRPLSGRLTMVISSTLKDSRVQVYRDIETALKFAKNHDRDIWIAGGRDVYLEGLKIADKMYLSMIPDDTPADRDTIIFPWWEAISGNWIVTEPITNKHNKDIVVHLLERSK